LAASVSAWTFSCRIHTDDEGLRRIIGAEPLTWVRDLRLTSDGGQTSDQHRLLRSTSEVQLTAPRVPHRPSASRLLR